MIILESVVLKGTQFKQRKFHVPYWMTVLSEVFGDWGDTPQSQVKLQANLGAKGCWVRGLELLDSNGKVGLLIKVGKEVV